MSVVPVDCVINSDYRCLDFAFLDLMESQTDLQEICF